MAIIFENDDKVNKKQIYIPQKAKKVFKVMKDLYKPYIDMNVDGSKVMKSLGSDKKYNKRGASASQNGKDVEQDSVSLNDAKVRLHRMNKMNKNSLEYQMNGGELAADIYRRGIQASKGVKEVDKVKPPKPTANAATKPSELDTKEISKPNGKVKYTITSENRKINESYDEDNPFYEMLFDYGPRYVFDEFLKNPNGEQDWGTLINPTMYKKALSEFTKYGHFVNFPTKYIYQWMGIIMKNTAILVANTSIAGHSQWFPSDEFEDFLESYFGGKREYDFDMKNDEIQFEVSKDEIMSLCDGINPFINEVTDKYGQTYFPWVTQMDANRYADQQDAQRMAEQFADIIDDVNMFNSKHYNEKIKLNNRNGKAYLVMDSSNFLEYIGLFDWMKMPDGSDAFSDYGIEPLEKVINEYNEDLPPEKVIVIVNKALDIYHMRGDMSSIFVQGGTKSLDWVSEQIKRNKKKIYMTEAQVARLYKLLKNG